MSEVVKGDRIRVRSHPYTEELKKYKLEPGVVRGEPDGYGRVSVLLDNGEDIYGFNTADFKRCSGRRPVATVRSSTMFNFRFWNEWEEEQDRKFYPLAFT